MSSASTGLYGSTGVRCRLVFQSESNIAVVIFTVYYYLW